MSSAAIAAGGALPNVGPIPRSRRRPWYQRFRTEFWVLCVVASVISLDNLRVGFYYIRPTDLVIDLSLVYALWMYLNGRLSKGVVWLLGLYYASLGLRVLMEIGSLGGGGALRTLLGMAGVFSAPVIYFVVRQTSVSRSAMVKLLAIGVLISLLSQMAVLPVQEAYVNAVMDLSPYVGLERPDPEASPIWPDTTITVWRAFAVGVSFAALVARVGIWVKLLGLLGIMLQFGAGGGSRSGLLFVVGVPVFLMVFQGRASISRRFRRLIGAAAVGLGLGVLYYFAPVAETDLTKEQVTHQQRVLQLFDLFSGDVKEGAAIPGLSGRAVAYLWYWQGITSSARNFFLGTGLSGGAAFIDSPLEQAHNVFLDVWGLSGLLGLSFVVTFLFLVTRDLMGLLRVAPARGPAQFIALSLAGAVLFMFQWLMFQATTSDRPFTAVFYLLSGLLLPTTHLMNRMTLRRPGPAAQRPPSEQSNGVGAN